MSTVIVALRFSRHQNSEESRQIFKGDNSVIDATPTIGLHIEITRVQYVTNSYDIIHGFLPDEFDAQLIPGAFQALKLKVNVV